MAEQWTDNAFILSVSPFNERDALVEMLTCQHGRIKSIAKFGNTSRQRPVLQTGNLVQVEWHARLASQLGSIQVEMLTPYFGLLSATPLHLLIVQSASALCSRFLYEHDRAEEIFEAMHHVYKIAATQNSQQAIRSYALFEQELLKSCGFALDLSSCAATGSREQLCYVSPKSGRAVSAQAGEAWKDKLLPLPTFLIHPQHTPDARELLDALRLNAYFMIRRLCGEHDNKANQHGLPECRERLELKLARMND